MTQYVQEKVAHIEKPLTAWILLSTIAVCIFTYAYFVNGAIAHIVATKEMQSNIAVLTTSVSNLESSYLAAKQAVTLDYALARGFTQNISDSVYISKKTVGALSFNR